MKEEFNPFILYTLNELEGMLEDLRERIEILKGNIYHTSHPTFIRISGWEAEIKVLESILAERILLQ